MGQVQSAEESTPRSCRRQGRRGGFVNGTNGLRAGFRVPDRCRQAKYMFHAGQVQPTAAAAAAPGILEGENGPAMTVERGKILGSGDEEDVEFLEALKGLVDGAVKLLGADKGVGNWLMSGLLRKSGVVESFVDSMVVFVNRRVGALVEVLSPKDAACAISRGLRQHVQAHDATTAALGIRAGRVVSEGMVDEEGDEAEGVAQGELEEHDVQVVRLWRQWKLSGGFWPPQMPDPEDPVFDGPDGTKDFVAKLDDGTQSFLRDASRSFCEVALPEDQGELEAACEAAAVDRGEASGSGGTRGAGGDSSRSVMETASRLAQVKSGVLEPMLCQVLTQQVVGRFCQSAKLWQFVLQLFLPGSSLNPAVRDMKYPEAFSLVAGALERSESTPTGTLRMELMQGLVKMAWGGTSDREVSNSRGATAPARETGTQPGSGNLGGSRVVKPEKLVAPTKTGGSKAIERSDSADTARWSEPELGSGSIDTDGGHRSPRSGAAPVGTVGREKPGGARDIFNIPYTEQLSHGLVGGEKDKFYEDLEEHALEELAKYLQSEIVDKVPLANVLLPESWIPDRVKAARGFARRPTNLMLVLSMIDAAKQVFVAAGDKDRRKASRVANGARAGASQAAVHSGGVSERNKDGGRPKVPVDGRQNTQAKGDSDLHQLESKSEGAGQGLLCRQRGGGRRDTPGWRAWEARRECFFGMDVGVAALHVGRSLLGQEAVDLGDAILKSVSLEYCSVEAVVRDEASSALRKCSNTASPDMLRAVKPLSTQPILYVSSQMRMLRALKKTGLDFSKSFGDGPQKKALSRRFKSYSWIFTDALIDKLADLSAEDAARSRAIEGESNPTGPLLPKGEGGQSEGVLFLDREPNNMDASRAERERRWKERKRQRRKSKSVVMREMTAGCGSSKDLLVKVVGSWLPDVLAADRAAERRVNGGSA